MKLELGFIKINDVQFSNECAVKDGILYVNPEDVKAFIYDNDDVKSYIKSIMFQRICSHWKKTMIMPLVELI